MATTVTIGGFSVHGNQRHTWGTFTTADQDTTITVITGLNYIFDYSLDLDTDAYDAPRPKLSVSGGTITGVVDNTDALSGRYEATGR